MRRPTTPQASGSPTGVDQEVVDRCSAIAYGHAKETFGCGARHGVRIFGEDGGFANLVSVDGARIALTSDGIGTKAEVAERVGRYDTLGFDLVAMVADDLIAVGAEPFAMSNIIDADRLDADVIDGLMRGLVRAATSCGLVVTGGEIACLGRRVGGYGSGSHVNWCATALGRIPPGREPISGRAIRAGDAVIALANVGLRSNGLTLARAILEAALGDAWHAVEWRGRAWGDLALTPSTVFAPAVADLLRAGHDVRGVAHVTGGGIPANLGRILAGRGLGARLDQLFPPDDWGVELCRLGDVAPVVAYGQWNLGNGMLVVVPADETAAAVARLETCGVAARHAGEIVHGDAVEIDACAWEFGVLSYPVA